MAKASGEPVPEAVPKTILIVEDDVLIRLSIADDLAGAGYHVVQAANADEALKVLNSTIAIDLIMTDIRMSGPLDGLALAGQVRAHWPALKIVVLSGDLPTVRPGNLADLYLSKPYDVSTILSVMKHLLSV